MAIDSMGADVIAVAPDQESAGPTERFSKRESPEEAFKCWAEGIKLLADQAHGVKQSRVRRPTLVPLGCSQSNHKRMLVLPVGPRSDRQRSTLFDIKSYQGASFKFRQLMTTS